MRKAAALVQRLTDGLAAAAGAAARSVEALVDTVFPQPQLVPVRIRRNGSERRR